MGISDPSTAVAGIEYMYTGGFGICNWITLRVDDDSRDQYRYLVPTNRGPSAQVSNI
jgi:hypothetical protein